MQKVTLYLADGRTVDVDTELTDVVVWGSRAFVVKEGQYHEVTVHYVPAPTKHVLVGSERVEDRKPT